LRPALQTVLQTLTPKYPEQNWTGGLIQAVEYFCKAESPKSKSTSTKTKKMIDPYKLPKNV
jgi:hypothetical protein